MTECFLGLDLGGTWIKGAAVPTDSDVTPRSFTDDKKIRNPSVVSRSLEEFVVPLREFCQQLADGAVIRGVVASTAAAVDGAGTRYRVAGEHLGIMGTCPWRERIHNPAISITIATDGARSGSDGE